MSSGKASPLPEAGHWQPIRESIRSVAVTSTSDWLITASADGTVRRWNLKSATPERTSEELHNENRAAGSANEAALKERPDAEIHIRPLAQGRRLAR